MLPSTRLPARINRPEKPGTGAIHFVLWLGTLLAVGVTLLMGSPGSTANSEELIVCGWDEVFVLDTSRQPAVKTWSWKAADRSELPEEIRPKLKTTDDCKPVDGGRRILITSSSGAVALVERASKKALFYASVINAHSAEMLPAGRVIVASSTHPTAPGDRLVLFDVTKSGVPLFDTEFHAAHGMVWDQARQLLWALGYRYLRAFRLADWNTPHPWLDKVAEYPLPDNDGHDLSPVPGTGLLALTTGRRAWFFDRDRRVFSPHPQLGVLAGIKSISVHPVTGRIAWTQADKGFWWTATLRFLKPDGTLELTGQRLYKVRWATMPK